MVASGLAAAVSVELLAVEAVELLVVELLLLEAVVLELLVEAVLSAAVEVVSSSSSLDARFCGGGLFLAESVFFSTCASSSSPFR